ncbi:MAG: SgrR family transcriptional regulator [Burkholderiales bacterium]|nr:SgrR family transcriptional regulator [Burkholderiales bacterium]
MKLRDQYKKLHTLLRDKAQPGLPALAIAMGCSERNMRILLSRMQEQGWLRWTSARGRGHHSNLEFIKSPDALALDHLNGLLARGELEQAFASLGKNQRQQLVNRLPEYLGIPDQNLQRLRMPLYRQIVSLDPLESYGRLEAHLIRQIFARLTTFDHQTMSLQPVLAHYWESGHEARVWHFWLRPGLSFHDGSELTVEDVRATFLRLRDRPSIYQNLYRHLEKIESGSGRRISFYLARSDWLWPQCLATAMSSIVPRRREKNFAQFPIGSGAFKVVRNNPYQLTLQAFHDYYREGALLDEIDLWVLQPSEESVCFDMQFGYSPASSMPQQHLRIADSGCTYLICNPDCHFFQTAEQRLALADWLAPAALFDQNDPARQPAHGLIPGWKHRVARPATAPVFKRGKRIRFVSSEVREMVQLAKAIKERLEAAGMEVEWRTVNFKTLIARDWMADCDLYLAREIMHDDKDFGCFEWFSADMHFRRWMSAEANAAIDAQLLKIQAQEDVPKRLRGYAKIGRKLVHEGWLIPISHENHFVSVAPHVAGVRLTPLGFVSFRELWLREAI